MTETLPSPLRVLAYSVTTFMIAFLGLVFAYRSAMG
jgi:hypothetical protein